MARKTPRKGVNTMKLDTMNIVLIVMSLVLGVTYMSIRNSRKSKERRSNRRSL